MSDFWDYSYQQAMKLINKKHDLINIQILDKAEFNIPEVGMIKLHDVENQTAIWIDAHKSQIRTTTSNYIRNKNRILKSFCRKNKIDLISIDTSKGYLYPLEQFFNSRIKRY